MEMPDGSILPAADVAAAAESARRTRSAAHVLASGDVAVGESEPARKDDRKKAKKEKKEKKPKKEKKAKRDKKERRDKGDRAASKGEEPAGADTRTQGSSGERERRAPPASRPSASSLRPFLSGDGSAADASESPSTWQGGAGASAGPGPVEGDDPDISRLLALAQGADAGLSPMAGVAPTSHHTAPAASHPPEGEGEGVPTSEDEAEGAAPVAPKRGVAPERGHTARATEAGSSTPVWSVGGGRGSRRGARSALPTESAGSTPVGERSPKPQRPPSPTAGPEAEGPASVPPLPRGRSEGRGEERALSLAGAGAGAGVSSESEDEGEGGEGVAGYIRVGETRTAKEWQEQSPAAGMESSSSSEEEGEEGARGGMSAAALEALDAVVEECIEEATEAGRLRSWEEAAEGVSGEPSARLVRMYRELRPDETLSDDEDVKRSTSRSDRALRKEAGAR